MLNNLLKKSFIVFGVFVLLALPVFAFAQTQISVAIPGTNSNGSAASPGAFVDNFYQFALMIGGILAFGAIVFGGVKYMASAGNPSGQSDAKEWIWGALTGLVLLAGAYLILHVVNPQLVNLNINPLTPTNVDMGTQTSYAGTPMTYGCAAGNAVIACSPGNLSNCSDVPNGACSGKACTQYPTAQCGTVTTTSTCAIPPIAPITDAQASQMEGGATVIWTSSDPAVQKNLSLLQAAFGKFQQALASVGDSGSLQSVYRPLAYQQHLYEIFHDANQFGVYGCQATGGGGSCPPPINAYADNASCKPLISALQAEENKHGICKTPTQCLVAQPSNCSPHVAGIGMDFKLSATSPVSYGPLNTVLTNAGVGIHWQNLGATDPVHFQLDVPPGVSCPG